MPRRFKLPLIQKIMAMEEDDQYEVSKNDEEAIAEAFRSPVLYSTVQEYLAYT